MSPYQQFAAMMQSLNAGSRPGGPGYSMGPLMQLAKLQQLKSQQTGQPIMQLPGINEYNTNEGPVGGLSQLFAQLKQQMPMMNSNQMNGMDSSGLK